MDHQHLNVPTAQLTAPPRPAHATDRYDGPTTLYRLFDADDQLLYIGITCNPPQRWEAHRQDKPWWKLVARKELTTYPDRSAALTAERDAIQTENPHHNVAGNPRRKRQHVHLVLDAEQAQKLHALAQRTGLSNSEALYTLIDGLPADRVVPERRVAAVGRIIRKGHRVLTVRATPAGVTGSIRRAVTR